MNDSTSTTSAQVLLIEGAKTESGSLSVVLDRGTYNIVKAESLSHATTLINRSEVHVVVLTLEQGQSDGADIVRQIRYQSPYTEIIAVVRPENASQIAGIDEAGAFDCLTGPLSPERMLSRVQKAVEHRRIKIERSLLKEQVAMRYCFDNVIGVSKAVTDLKATMARIAPTDIPILITGASGTGKELTARVIHFHSRRRNKPLIVVDCLSLPQDILLSQMFGGAGQTEPSLLERADRGTLVLDNIGGMSEAVQDRMLAFLRDFRVGENDDQARRLDIRFVSLTGEGLNVQTESGEFSQDLLNQLSPVTIELPLLTERADDIEILIDHFLQTIASENDDRPKTIARTAVDRLLHYRWPGNIRELENTVRRAVALCHRDQLEIEDISFVGSGLETNSSPRPQSAAHVPVSRLDESQRTLIQRALVENDWNYTQTAQELGIGRTTLWRKVKKFDLKREAEIASSDRRQES